MKRKIVAGICLLWIACLWTRLYPAQASDELPAAIDKEKLAASIRQAFDRSDFNGYVLVTKDGKVLYSGGSGAISDTSDRRPDENTVFGIASITKPLTALGIALLEQRGAIQYTDTIDNYLENVPEDKKRITIHELLTHTSGIVSDVASDTERLGKQELLTRIFRSKLQFDPGSRFAYSNAGYSLLAAIIDRVSGLSYADFMREEVFKPLGMSNTGSTGMAFFKQLHVTNGYYNGKDYGKLSDYPLSWNGLIGNGDILSTPKDMSSLFRNLFAGKLLTPANLAKVLTPYVAEGDGGDYFYGYGWDIRTDERDGKIIGHNGGGMSGNHIVTYYEKYGLAVLVFNTRLDERLLFGKFPYDIDYPSDQLSEAIIANLFSGKYDRMPSPILPLWLGVAKYSGIVCVLLGICAALAMFVRRRLVRRR